MKMISLKTAARDKKSGAKEMRRSNVVPCVLYGNEVPNTQVQCAYNEISKAYTQAGESALVDLDVLGKNIPVLFHAVDFDPATDKITHVDFYAVNMKKEIEAKVPIHFEGESLAVKDMGGVMVTVLDHLTVKCLPGDLPHSISVNISKLETFQESLLVSDVTVPDKVFVLEDEEMMIATVQEPRKEEEVVPIVAEGEGEGEGEAAGQEGGDTDEKKEGEGAAVEGGAEEKKAEKSS